MKDWFVKENGGNGHLVGVASKGSDWFVAEEILPEDSKLIASAPDLLEACKRFVESSACQNNCDPEDMTCDTNFAIKAIKKAEGDNT